MTKDKRIENRITRSDYELLEKAVDIVKTDKHAKYYGISSFMIESSVSRAKKLIAKASK